jgi:NADP-dependent 3-hydroxy acid dehydrogenase YdfG
MIADFRVALVTGASSGIGRAVAERLRRAGMRVLAVGRDKAALGSLAATCGAEPLAIDVRETTELARVFAENAIDILINNAGILSTRAPFQEIDPADIDAMVDVNLRAPLHLARLAIPSMIAHRRGHLVFMGSSAGRWPHPNSSVYGASKAGISLFCDALRSDLLGTGVRVSEIAPGRVETKLYRDTIGSDSARAELYDGYDAIRPEDIAELIFTVLAAPANVDVSRLEVFPTDQALAGARMVKSHLKTVSDRP